MFRRAFRTLALPLAACAIAAAAATPAPAAGPVVVGRIDTATGLAYTMENILVTAFTDGTPITKFAIGYSDVSQAWVFVRAGQPAGGGCRKEVFRLVRISDNRLALADPTNRNIAWGVNATPKLIVPTFDCISTTCQDCHSSSDGSPAQTNLESPDCHCSNTTPGQSNDCRTTMPGLGGPYLPGGVVKDKYD